MRDGERNESGGRRGSARKEVNEVLEGRKERWREDKKMKEDKRCWNEPRGSCREDEGERLECGGREEEEWITGRRGNEESESGGRLE